MKEKPQEDILTGINLEDKQEVTEQNSVPKLIFPEMKKFGNS